MIKETYLDEDITTAWPPELAVYSSHRMPINLPAAIPVAYTGVTFK